jgi:prepilin-type N-terminal cleavage/methylation domain-containing protein
MSATLFNRRPTMTCRDARAGFTLIELMVALASSTLLVAGLSSAIYISSQALDLDSSTSRQSAVASEVLAELTADLSLAHSFSERTATAVTFDVPDRDGDLHPETIRYAWSGTPGDPLTYQYNSGSEITLATDVQSFDLTALTRALIAPEVATLLIDVVFEEFTEAKLSSNDSSLDIPVPSGTNVGDLLIAMVALDGSLDGLTAPADWNQLVLESQSGRMHLGVWWKIATGSEGATYTFTWDSSEQAYGSVMRFTGHDPSSPIDQYEFDSGSSTAPTVPEVTTSVNNTMILRLGGFDDDDVSIDDPGMTGHTTITMDGSNTGSNTASGGAAYAFQSSAGDSGTASFALTGSEEYVTVTIAIASNQSP